MKNEQLSAAARSVGIDLIGLVDPTVLSRFGNYLQNYEHERVAFFRGDIMERIDVKKAWADTTCMLSFAVGYNVTLEPPDDHDLRGIVSKCAYGRDYHAVLRERGERLMEKLNADGQYCGGYRIFADTGQLSDRALAYSAGLGYYGKNNFLINPKLGSFLFLGHILLDQAFEVDYLPIMESDCGECRRCLDGCPHHAYKENGVLDFEKCISYQTQKGRGSDTHGYVYGCDICQNVCPVNRQAAKCTDPDFSCSPELAYPRLAELAELSEAEFYARYGQSSLAWRGAKNLSRVSREMLAQRVRGGEKEDSR